MCYPFLKLSVDHFPSSSPSDERMERSRLREEGGTRGTTKKKKKERRVALNSQSTKQDVERKVKKKKKRKERRIVHPSETRFEPREWLASQLAYGDDEITFYMYIYERKRGSRWRERPRRWE